VQNLARAGDNIVSSTDFYGGTRNLFAHTLQMRRSIRAAFATDQAASRPARTISTTFQTSLDLGLRRGNIGGIAFRARADGN
jgi:O-acetylhomoserine/O-acetylserine sulfhydrylase-like pyridoxal-dependent enzyme